MHFRAVPGGQTQWFLQLNSSVSFGSIIGMGGVQNAEDAIEFLLAGATAVAVGTANFHNPMTTVEVIDGIADYMKAHQVEKVTDLIGAVRG